MVTCFTHVLLNKSKSASNDLFDAFRMCLLCLHSEGDTYGTGGGGSGGLLVCPPTCPDADVDLAPRLHYLNGRSAPFHSQYAIAVPTGEAST